MFSSKSDAAEPAKSHTPALKRKSLMSARADQRANEQREQRQRRAGMDKVMAKNAQAMTPQLKELLMNRLM